MDNTKMNLKFQMFTNLCMADLQFDTPDEFMHLFNRSFDFITEGVDLEDKKPKGGSIVQLVN